MNKPTCIIVNGEKTGEIRKVIFGLTKKSGGRMAEKITFWNTLFSKILILPLANLEEIPRQTKNIILITSDGSQKTKIGEWARKLKSNDSFVYNFDSGETKIGVEKYDCRTLSFGYENGADSRISDVNVNEKETQTNFKAIFENHIVPFWLKGSWKRNDFYIILAAIGCALELGLNLVEISQILKNSK